MTQHGSGTLFWSVWDGTAQPCGFTAAPPPHRPPVDGALAVGGGDGGGRPAGPQLVWPAQIGANRLFSIHAGGFLAEPLEPFYVLAMGLGLVGLLVTGAQLLPLLARRRPAQGERLLHSQLALVALVPLLLTAVSGVLFRLLDAWSPLPAARFRWLMALHQGGWLGPQLKPVYVLLVGVGLVGLLATGGRMLIGPRRAAT